MPSMPRRSKEVTFLFCILLLQAFQGSLKMFNGKTFQVIGIGQCSIGHAIIVLVSAM